MRDQANDRDNAAIVTLDARARVNVRPRRVCGPCARRCDVPRPVGEIGRRQIQQAGLERLALRLVAGDCPSCLLLCSGWGSGLLWMGQSLDVLQASRDVDRPRAGAGRVALRDALHSRSGGRGGVDAFTVPAALRAFTLRLLTRGLIVVAVQEGIMPAPSLGLFASMGVQTAFSAVSTLSPR